MRLQELDEYFKGLLQIDALAGIDSSLNGVQVGDLSSDIKRVAFAVDACMETFKRAVDGGADLLFVHHGLFWGFDKRITRSHFNRLELLFANHCGLYACHLPLDMHPEIGNNAGISAKLGLSDLAPFGEYHGLQIGLQGTLDPPLDLDSVLLKLGFDREMCAAVLNFGGKSNASVGVVSGGAIGQVQEVIDGNLDLYITGEMSHQFYHLCLEEEVNLLCGGHYQTETFGVSLLAERLRRDTGLETSFIDVPTGL
jgi:dinuclear metal center YbgI/SA1388 family protein